VQGSLKKRNNSAVYFLSLLPEETSYFHLYLEKLTLIINSFREKPVKREEKSSEVLFFAG